MSRLAKLAFWISSFTFALAQADVASASNMHTITKDVVIIGGGASGAYAAIRLKEDYKKSVVVVEKEARLGGHVSPYRDPKTGRNFDVGVQVYIDSATVRSFFARLNITTTPWANPGHPSRYADFGTGNAVNFTAPAFVPDVLNAMQNFLAAITPYESLYLPGFFNFPSKDAIPADLLLPFGEFLKKYNAEGAIITMFQSTGLGMGDMLGSTTLYVLGAFPGPFARALLGIDAVYKPSSDRNIEVYEKIAQRLGKDVLYKTTVHSSTRTDTGVTLVVRNASGKLTKIVAGKLLVSIEPTPENFKPFALDQAEKDVFSKLKYTNEYIFLVSHPSLPAGTTIFNIQEAAATSNVPALPKLNLLSGFEFHGNASKPLYKINVVGSEKFTLADAKALINAQFKKLMDKNTIPKSKQPLEIVNIAVHGAMHMYTDLSVLQSGFIQQMYALQGRRSTWFTGAAWSSGYQSILWEFDDVLLQKMFGAA